MDMTTYALHGTEYHLLLNGMALFDCYEHFGREKSLTELIEGEDRDAYQALVWMLCCFSLQGELARRYAGLDKGAYLEYGRTLTELTPKDIPMAKAAVLRTIVSGFRHPEGRDEVDVFLAEIESKKKQASPGGNIFTRLRRSLASRPGTP